MKQFDIEEDGIQLPENYKPTYIGEQHNNNCQQFFGPIVNCTFTMPPVKATSPSKSKDKSEKAKKSKDTLGQDKPKTLMYYKNTNKGYLLKQQKRVDVVFRKFNEWKWLDDKTAPEDFDSFFKGEPRYCNISWVGTTTTLTILIQKLLEQDYITKQTGCKTKSLVEKQFRLTPNYDANRIDQDTFDKINITTLILDPGKPLPERQTIDGENEIDIQDAALMEIYSGQLRSTKGI